MNNIRKYILMFAAVVLFSCGKDYKDDIDKLNSTHTSIEQRVTSLETQVTKINSQLSQLSVLASAVEQGFYITQVKTTATGYELTLNNGRVIVLQNGPDKILTPMPAVSMTQISGLYYWTLNGVLLTGSDGKPISSTGIAPVVRYDYTTMQWVISTDGGTTFQDVNTFASVVLNDTVLMQVINNYVRQHSTKAISQEVLFQIISTYIQKNYVQLFNIEILDEVVVNYVNKRYTRIFSYEMLEKIFNQYNFEYMTSQIKVEELVNVIVNFIREHKEIFIDNEVLYEIISSYIQMNKTTIFTNELLLEVINNFIENNENFIDVEVLTQVVNNYIEEHKEVVFNTEVVKNVIMEYVRRNYVKLFSQEILVQVLNTYVTKNSTTIFNRTLIEEVVNNYVQNNYTTIFKQETIVELINNYLKVNSTTVLKREVLIDVITSYFEKNYNLFIDRTVITTVINDYITKHQTTIISVDIVKQIINNYLEKYYAEIFTVDLLNEIVVNYFNENQKVFLEIVNENIGVIQDVKVTDDYCTITLKGGNKIKLVVYDAMARLRDRVQSIVAMPNANGHFEETEVGQSGALTSLPYLVSPASMAQVIQSKFYHDEIDIELKATDGNGNISTLSVYEPQSTSDGVLYVNASTPAYGTIKAVALHIKEKRTGGTDIMTEFTVVDTEFDPRITQEIPEEYLRQMRPYMPIYSGNTPPSIEGTYLLCKDILVYDSNNYYEPGHWFMDYITDFSHQDMTKNTIFFRGEERYEKTVNSKSDWTEAIVLGKDNNFTVFIIDNSKYNDGYTTFKTANIFSGTKTNNGIKGLYRGIVVLDKNDPNNILMNVGEFRIFKDEDGLSEPTSWMARQTTRNSTNGSVVYELPSCIDAK